MKHNVIKWIVTSNARRWLVDANFSLAHEWSIVWLSKSLPRLNVGDDTARLWVRGGWCQTHLDSNPGFPTYFSFCLDSVSSSVQWGIITIPTWWVVMRIKGDRWHVISFLLIISFLKGCAWPFTGESGPSVSVSLNFAQWNGLGSFSGLSLGHIRRVTAEPLGLGRQHQSFGKRPGDSSKQPQLRFTVSPSLPKSMWFGSGSLGSNPALST